MDLKIPKPNPKQAIFFKSRKRYIGYGGARGGGKSWAMRTKLALLAMHYPNLNILLLRRTLVDLKENHLIPLLSLLKGIARYKSTDKVFEFANGSRLRLGYCNNAKDVENFRGQEYDVIGMEECTQFYWSEVQMLITANRNTKSYFKPRMYFTGNPGGVGHNWFKRLFVKGDYSTDENKKEYEFIAATVEDNHVLMHYNPEYVKVLESLPEKQRAAQRYGNWDVFEGQFFEEFTDDPTHYADRRYTHVIEPFDPPNHWIITRSFDYGYAKPFSFGWWAIDGDGRFYRICELYGCTNTPNEGIKWTREKIFSEAQKTEQQHPYLKGKYITGVADPAIWDGSSGRSAADIASDYGIYFSKADNERVAGWAEVHSRLKFDNFGIPMMYVFKNCKSTIRTLPELIYDSTRTEDLDTTAEDHIADEIRYMMMTRQMRAQIPKTAPKKIKNPLDL